MLHVCVRACVCTNIHTKDRRSLAVAVELHRALASSARSRVAHPLAWVAARAARGTLLVALVARLNRPVARHGADTGAAMQYVAAWLVTLELAVRASLHARLMATETVSADDLAAGEAGPRQSGLGIG